MSHKFNILQIAKRLPTSAPQWMRDDVATMASIVDAFENEVAEIDRDPLLSQQGRAERKHGLLSSGLSNHLDQIGARVKSEAARVATARAALKLPEPDKTDLHSLSRQQERRTWLRSLPDGGRSKYLMTDDDRKRLPKAQADKLPKVDALTLQAILSEPAALSGANEQLWQRLNDAELDKLHAGRFAELAAESEALANVSAAIQVSTQIMHSLADASPAPKVA